MSSTNHDVNLILKARDEASAKLNKVNSTIKKVAAGIIGYFSARAITGFLKSSVAAFSEQEQVVRGLSDALESVGEAADLKRYEAFASYMQKITTYGDEAILSTMKLGVTIGGLAGKDLEAATVAAIGLSKAFNLDLNAAMTLVGKAAAGNFGAFSRMGITFREGMTDAEKYAEVLERGAAGFRIAQGETDTFRGILEQLKNAWGDAKEGVGKYIAESEKLRNVFKAITFGLANLVDVSKWAWANMKAHVETYKESLGSKFSVPIGVSLGNLWASIVSKEYRTYAAKGDPNWQADVNFYRGQRSQNSSVPFLSENADKMAEILAKKWNEMFIESSSFNAAAAVAGAGMGRTRTEVEKSLGGAGKSGWTLFESRTAGGVHVQSPESRKLDRMIDLLAKIANQSSRQERKEAYGRNGNPQLLLTNFR